MRGKDFAARKLLLLSVLILGAGSAAAEEALAPAKPRTAVFVLDASQSMQEKLEDAAKIDIARKVLSQVIGAHADTHSLGLIAFGHRKASDCVDAEVLIKPGELEAGAYEQVLGSIEAKGQAPIAASIKNAASLAGPLDIVLIADGGDTCKADLCATADALKQEPNGVRIHVSGLSGKPDTVQNLACAAAATGGKFVAASNEPELQNGLNTVFASIDAPPAAPATAATPAAPGPAVNSFVPIAPLPSSPGETAVFKSTTPGGTVALAPRVVPVSPAPPKTQPVRPVPVSFNAQITQDGPKLRSGLIWRVYNAKAKTGGGFELISTHREPAPTATLLPGEYLVNASYGLSNLTKKIKVEGSESLEETFVLNTGGLALRAILATGQECPPGTVRFDVMSDEQDQFGVRETILADANPRTMIRLNAGAYHVKSLYGDANADVGVNITIEPGRITEATIKHTGVKITFRLVQSAGGEALADTKWTILTSAGDTVKTNAGALPTHILAAGSYAVVADHGEQSYSKKFSIEPGNDKQIEVAVENGPTSPDALKALLDPPEASAPGTGGLSVEAPGGAMTFDGFSRPADPNAPLLNPGTLLRSP